jgi:hypothetical protein
MQVKHKSQTMNKQLDKSNLVPKINDDQPIPTVVNGVIRVKKLIKHIMNIKKTI